MNRERMWTSDDVVQPRPHHSFGGVAMEQSLQHLTVYLECRVSFR